MAKRRKVDVFLKVRDFLALIPEEQLAVPEKLKAAMSEEENALVKLSLKLPRTELKRNVSTMEEGFILATAEGDSREVDSSPQKPVVQEDTGKSERIFEKQVQSLEKEGLPAGDSVLQRKVLIVDDQRFSRQLLSDLVVEAGFEAYAVDNAKDALEEGEKSSFFCIITDLEMPEMNGLELLEQIKERDPLQEVVIVTGKASIETAVEALKKGATDYLIKPVDKHALTMLLTRLFRQKTLEMERNLLQISSRNLERENVELKKFLQFFEQSREISSELEVEKLLHRIVEFATLQTNALKGSLFLIEEKEKALVLKASKGIGPEAIRKFRMGEGFLGKVAQKGEPVLLAPPKPKRTKDSGTAQLRTIPSCIYIPLKYRRHVVGILSVFDKLDGSVFTRTDQLLLSLLGEQTVIAIRNAHLIEQSRAKKVRDTNTDLYTFPFFEEYYRKELERAESEKTSFTIGMFAFRKLEDKSLRLSQKEWYHLKRKLGLIASKTLRNTDILAQYKRNRFCFLLTMLPDTVADSVIERFSVTLTRELKALKIVEGEKDIALSYLKKEECSEKHLDEIVDNLGQECRTYCLGETMTG